MTPHADACDQAIFLPCWQGIISYGELSWDSFLTVESVVQVGQSITCKVLQVQKQRRKILLSLKQMEVSGCRVPSALGAARKQQGGRQM